MWRYFWTVNGCCSQSPYFANYGEKYDFWLSNFTELSVGRAGLAQSEHQENVFSKLFPQFSKHFVQFSNNAKIIVMLASVHGNFLKYSPPKVFGRSTRAISSYFAVNIFQKCGRFLLPTVITIYASSKYFTYFCTKFWNFGQLLLIFEEKYRIFYIFWKIWPIFTLTKFQYVPYSLSS